MYGRARRDAGAAAVGVLEEAREAVELDRLGGAMAGRAAEVAAVAARAA